MSHHSRDNPRRPREAQRLFTWTESKMFTAREIFNGRLGNQPLLLAISSGFYSNDRGPGINHMQRFETGEVLFAFQRAFQRRVLLHDSHDRTLSFPLLSPLLFSVKEMAMTLEEIVKSMTLPVRLSFHQKEDLVFVVDRDFKNHLFFGDLTLVSVYLEPFLCCLSIGNEDGKASSEVFALPCRMRQLGLSLVDGIKQQSALSDTFKRYCWTYEEACKAASPLKDTFFKELAFVSRKAKIRQEADVPDYIDENTFIDIMRRRSTHSKEGADLSMQAKAQTGPQENTDAQYESLVSVDRDIHVYAASQSGVWDARNKLTPPREPAASDATAKSRLVRSVSAGDVFTPLAETQAGLPPPLPCRPQVASSGKAPALQPPVPPRVPLRSATTKTPFTSTTSVHDRPKHFNIEQLSVNDVCKGLQALGLEKHCKKFRKQRIDGKLLKKLSKRAFEEEFNLSQTEIVKLSTFIEEGHIPR